MKLPIFSIAGSTTTGFSNTATRYGQISGGIGGAVGTTIFRCYLPWAGNVHSLHVRALDAQNITNGGTYTIDVMVDGVSNNDPITGNPLAVVLSNTNFYQIDNTDVLQLAANSYLTLRVVPSGSPDAVGPVAPQISFVYEYPSSVNSVFFSMYNSASTNAFIGIGQSSTMGNEVEWGSVMPVDGKFLGMIFDRATAPVGSNTCEVVLRLNGSNTIVNTSVTSGARYSSMLANVDVVAGDIVSLGVYQTPGIAASIGTISLLFESSSNNTVIVPSRWGSLSTSATRFGAFGGNQGTTNSAFEFSTTIAPMNFTVTKVQALLNGAPGATRGRNFTLMANNNSTSMTVAVENTNTSSSNSGSLAITANTLLTTNTTPNNTPTAANGTYLTYLINVSGNNMNTRRRSQGISMTGVG
jgi:hypothetical protein